MARSHTDTTQKTQPLFVGSKTTTSYLNTRHFLIQFTQEHCLESDATLELKVGAHLVGIPAGASFGDNFFIWILFFKTQRVNK